jgi:hypothetical protein
MEGFPQNHTQKAIYFARMLMTRFVFVARGLCFQKRKSIDECFDKVAKEQVQVPISTKQPRNNCGEKLKKVVSN